MNRLVCFGLFLQPEEWFLNGPANATQPGCVRKQRRVSPVDWEGAGLGKPGVQRCNQPTMNSPPFGRARKVFNGFHSLPVLGEAIISAVKTPSAKQPPQPTLNSPPFGRAHMAL